MSSSLSRDFATLQCQLWNERYPVGTEVMIRHDSGHRTIATTRTKAELSPEGVPMIYVDPLSHPFTLDRCRPTRKHPSGQVPSTCIAA